MVKKTSSKTTSNPSSISPLLSRPGGFIGGKWVLKGEQTFDVRNPATGELLAKLPVMGVKETEAAIAVAAETVRQATPSLEARAGWLFKIVQLLKENREDLARIITLEQGKPLDESRGEIDYAVGFFQFFGDNIEVLRERRIAGPIRGCCWTVHHRPAGVVGLITPWNFPLAMLAKKLAAAIGAGCASVVKPASMTPLTCVALWSLLERIDLPKGCANLVLGSSSTIGEVIFRDDRVRLISFTGSTEVGRLIFAQSANSLKRLSLELGGNAPFIVFDDAAIEQAVNALIANKFRCAGQTCVSANRVYVHRDIHAAFTEALVERVKQIKVGNGLEPDTKIGPLINRESFRKVSKHVSDALRHGAKRVAGTAPVEPKQDWGFFFPPTVLTGAKPEMLAFREETFGPVISMATFRTEKEAIAAANSTQYGLASFVFTKDQARVERMAASLYFGHMAVNSGVSPTPEAPFGGFKQSGMGREGGIEGLLEFCEPQSVAMAND